MNFLVKKLKRVFYLDFSLHSNRHPNGQAIEEIKSWIQRREGHRTMGAMASLKSSTLPPKKKKKLKCYILKFMSTTITITYESRPTYIGVST